MKDPHKDGVRSHSPGRRLCPVFLLSAVAWLTIIGVLGSERVWSAVQVSPTPTDLPLGTATPSAVSKSENKVTTREQSRSGLGETHAKEKPAETSTPWGAIFTAIGAIIVGLIGFVSALRSDRRTLGKDIEITRLTGELSRRKDLELAHQNFIQTVQNEYDTKLRTQRIVQYRKLWELMIKLAKYPEPAPLSVDDLKSLSESFQKWYFSGGGLFLSENTRDSYFNLQDGCKIVLQKSEDRWPTGSDEASLKTNLERPDAWKPPEEITKLAEYRFEKRDHLPPDIVKQLRHLGSALRTSMTEDVLTRQAPLLSETAVATIK